MPQKINGAGQMQEYVPAGNGDPSGEYADGQGANKHFAVFAKPLPKSFTTTKTTTPKTPKLKKPTAKQTKQTQLDAKIDAVLQSKTIKTGKDMISTYKPTGLKNKHILGAMAKQGFDGLPQVVDADVFDAIVKKSNFVAMRAVRANSQSQADQFQDQLYNGQWYVTCENGGAQYGQGMYCAADYTGKITQGMKSEVQGYARGNRFSRVETLTLAPDAKVIKHLDIIKELKKRMDSDPDVYDAIHKRMAESIAKEVTGRALSTVKRTDPNLYDYINHEVEYRLTGDVKRNKKLNKQRTANLSMTERRAMFDIYGFADEFKKAQNPNSITNYGNNQIVSKMCKKLGFNDGELATIMGYDAINAEGHGSSGSYTVILNRTKTIFKKS